MVKKFNISGSSKASSFFTVFSILLSTTIITGVITGFILYTRRHTRPTGAIVTNGMECAAMGRKIFELGGNVADAAVTTVLCEGVTCPQSSGLGGGFFLTIYLKDMQVFRTLNARERAPLEAHMDMFKSASSIKGGLAVGVPGELKGILLFFFLICKSDFS
jgi:gamma-glutamyltranspeptidase / glutathione hydrolase / leukotriene-C4 hydrolase